MTSDPYPCVQKQGVSGPISLQSICPGTPKLTYRRFCILLGTTVSLYFLYSSSENSLPPSSSPTILCKTGMKENYKITFSNSTSFKKYIWREKIKIINIFALTTWIILHLPIFPNKPTFCILNRPPLHWLHFCRCVSFPFQSFL